MFECVCVCLCDKFTAVYIPELSKCNVFICMCVCTLLVCVREFWRESGFVCMKWWQGGARSGGGWWMVMRETNGASSHFMVVARREGRWIDK